VLLVYTLTMYTFTQHANAHVEEGLTEDKLANDLDLDLDSTFM